MEHINHRDHEFQYIMLHVHSKTLVQSHKLPTSPKQLSRAPHIFSLGIKWYNFFMEQGYTIHLHTMTHPATIITLPLLWNPSLKTCSPLLPSRFKTTVYIVTHIFQEVNLMIQWHFSCITHSYLNPPTFCVGYLHFLHCMHTLRPTRI